MSSSSHPNSSNTVNLNSVFALPASLRTFEMLPTPTSELVSIENSPKATFENAFNSPVPSTLSGMPVCPPPSPIRGPVSVYPTVLSGHKLVPLPCKKRHLKSACPVRPRRPRSRVVNPVPREKRVYKRCRCGVTNHIRRLYCHTCFLSRAEM